MNNSQQVAAIIENLLNERGISANKMLKDCGLAARLIGNMKTGSMPAADRLAKIAHYLDVSTDYLLTGKESVNEGGKEISAKEFLHNEGITDEEDIKALLRVMEMMRRKDYNSELANEFISKESSGN